ncbi:unnamed protein product [Orchesella dallaii]|uniref:C2H2-type domain-containing protein n=1 Tax=Orchesella dallaii TaxID=48710 RepID=A0ABP1RLH9_9HEXA
MDSIIPISYCLACCDEVDRNDKSGIKQEVEEVEDSCCDMETDLFNPETWKKKKEPEPDPRTNSSSLSPLLEDEDVVLSCFFKIFNAGGPLSKLEMWSSHEKREEGDVNVPVILPFCGACKSQLLALYRLQQELEKLERELKEKVISAESEFERNNVYQKDRRYLKIRRKILEDKKGQAGQRENVARKKRQAKKDEGQAPIGLEKTSSSDMIVDVPGSSSDTSISRRSSKRTSKPISRFGVGAASALTGTSDPIVLLSKQDKRRAEKYHQRLSKYVPLVDASDEDNEDLSANDPIYEPPSPASPNHSWSHDETDEEEEGEDESDSWMPPSSSRDDSLKATPKNKIKTRTRKRNDLKGDHKRSGSDSKSDEDEKSKDDSPVKIKRKPGRPKRIRRDSEEPLPGPKMKFKKSTICSVDRKTGTITILKVPLTRMEDGLSYKCSLCSEIFPSAKDKLTRHVIKKHSDRYKCHLCAKNLSSPRMLKIHLRVHTGAAPEVITECPICAKPFTRWPLFQNHKWSHYSEQERNEAVARGEKPPPSYDKKFQCEQCPRRFSTAKLLQMHLISIHQTEERPKELCPICGCAVLHLQAHIGRIHEVVPDEKKFACSLCDKKFTTNVLLKRHKNAVHFDLKAFQCTMCSKKFFTSWSLKEHIQFHLNIRNFKCEFCTSAFVRKYDFDRHMRVYHEEGSAPKRPPFIRGLKKTSLVKTGQSNSKPSASQNQVIHEIFVGNGGEESSSGASFKEELKHE